MEYIWKVLSTKEEYNADLNDKVVTEAHWGLFLRDGQYMTESQGITQFDPPNKDVYVAFSDLNNDIIMGWVKDKIGDAEVSNRINWVNHLLVQNKKSDNQV